MIKIKRIKNFFKRLIFAIAQNSMLVFIILFFLALIFGGFTFYKYSFLAEKIEPKIIKKPLEFKESLYQQISKTWQTRQEKFEKVDFKEIPDIFNPSIPPTKEQLTE